MSERPTHIVVDRARIAANWRAICDAVRPARVMPILKANAYGHGLVEVARLLEGLGADVLGLAYLEEGVRLRQEGVKTPILVLGGILGDQIPDFLDHDLTLTASSVDKLLAIEACAASRQTKAKVHLKVDTGMERIGVHWYSADKLLEASLRCPHVEVEGIFSHLANADAADLTDSHRQIERFHEVLRFYERRSLPMPLRHLANSGGILQLPESHLDLVRPGILLYGIYPTREVRQTIAVKPALTWKTKVVYFKVVKAGNAVSYGGTWAPAGDTRVVTLPIGYGDGYFRAASGRAEVLIHGHRYPVVGRICMDQMMVDLGQGSAYNADEVLLVGEQGSERITVEDLADWAGTIPYEVLTHVNTRVPRIYVGDST